MQGMSLVSSSSPRIVGSSWQFLSLSTVRHGYGHGHRPWKSLATLGVCSCLVTLVDGVATAAGRAVLFA